MNTPQLIGDDYWVLHSRSMAYNAGIVIRDQAALLIDPGVHRDEIAAISAFVADRRAVVTTILLTHSHWDHILGPELLPTAQIIAHTNYPSITTTHRERIGTAIDAWEQRCGYERTSPFQIPQPDVLAVHHHEFTLGGSRFQLIHIPGHAQDQLALYEYDSRILWAADTLSDLEIPFISENLADYDITLERLAALEIATIIPGHGAPSSDQHEIRARIDADRSYLAELRRRITAVVATDNTIDAARAACADMEFRHPDNNRNEHRMNCETVFFELGGQGDQTGLGWAAE